MDDLINFFKVLSDETRLRILVLLYHKKLCVCELTGIMKEKQPKISKHLAKLRDLGFVKDERQEQFIFYSINIKSELLLNILIEIITSSENYPFLKLDMENAQDADKYLIRCEK